MKRLLLILFCLLIYPFTPCSAAENVQMARMSMPIMAGSVAAGGAETIGYEATGGTTSSFSAGRIYCSAVDSPSHNGTVTSVSLYISNTTSTTDMEVGLYSGNPTTKTGTETLFSDIGELAVGWHDYNVEYTVSSGINYRICVRFSDNTAVGYCDVLSESYYRHDLAWGTEWPINWGGSVSTTRTYSFSAAVEW
jgi:hypothetical protein